MKALNYALATSISFVMLGCPPEPGKTGPVAVEKFACKKQGDRCGISGESDTVINLLAQHGKDERVPAPVKGDGKDPVWTYLGQTTSDQAVRLDTISDFSLCTPKITVENSSSELSAKPIEYQVSSSYSKVKKVDITLEVEANLVEIVKHLRDRAPEAPAESAADAQTVDAPAADDSAVPDDAAEAALAKSTDEDITAAVKAGVETSKSTWENSKSMYTVKVYSLDSDGTVARRRSCKGKGFGSRLIREVAVIETKLGSIDTKVASTMAANISAKLGWNDKAQADLTAEFQRALVEQTTVTWDDHRHIIAFGTDQL